jgi:hypothetical protein
MSKDISRRRVQPKYSTFVLERKAGRDERAGQALL